MSGCINDTVIRQEASDVKAASESKMERGQRGHEVSLLNSKRFVCWFIISCFM